jgi:hypothetical protein
MSHKIAQLSLDFAGEWSVCSGERRRHRFNGTPLKSRPISRKCGVGWSRTASVARVAEACSDAGNVEKGNEVALDIEELVHEVSIFLNAASLFSRLGQT